MTHVTERKGSPQTLVCRKTLRTFEQQCEQHSQDLAALRRLSALSDSATGAFPRLRKRIAAAGKRVPPSSSLT
jgi:hypothetical protein